MTSFFKKNISTFIILISIFGTASAEVDIDVIFGIGDGRPYYGRGYGGYGSGIVIYSEPSYRYYSSYRQTVASVQYRLAYLGYYSGPIDGIMGSGTRRALRNFQSDYGIYPSGNINNITLYRLRLI